MVFVSKESFRVGDDWATAGPTGGTGATGPTGASVPPATGATPPPATGATPPAPAPPPDAQDQGGPTGPTDTVSFLAVDGDDQVINVDLDGDGDTDVVLVADTDDDNTTPPTV